MQQKLSCTILYVLACIAVQSPGVNFLDVLAKLQHLPHAGSPVGTPLCAPTLSWGRAGAGCIALSVVCQARAAGLEAALLHVVGAQLPRLAALAVAAAMFTGLQLPLQQGLFFRELILCDPLVRPVHRVPAVQTIGKVCFTLTLETKTRAQLP